MIDLRSDTVAQPTEAMRQSALVSVLGDEGVHDDPTVRRLEVLSSALLGKEDALFCVSGTMANQLALLAHVGEGGRIIADENSHIIKYESGSLKLFKRATVYAIPSYNGRMEPQDIDRIGMGHLEGGLLCLENAHSIGIAVSKKYIVQMCDFAKARKMQTHLDGARIFNAALANNCSAKELASEVDSVMFSFSKGLCAPIGSILCGSNEVINKARHYQKLLGGTMHKTGFVAAPCIIALQEMISRLNEDHENAAQLRTLLSAIPGVKVVPGNINIVYFGFSDQGFNVAEFVNRLYNFSIITCPPEQTGLIRLVIHRGISTSDIVQIAKTVSLLSQSGT